MHQKVAKRYSLIDMFKLLFAVYIAVYHSFRMLGKNTILMDCTTELVVPFFFVTSGFLLFNKINNNPDNKKNIVYGYCKRILQLYLVWSAIMFLFKIPEIINIGFDIERQFTWWIKYFRVLLLIGDYQLWFLLGLVWAIIIFYYLYSNNKLIKPIFLAIILWTIRILLDCNLFKALNSPALDKVVHFYYLFFGTTQNGIFVGFVFLVLGCVFAKYKVKINNHLPMLMISVFMTILSFIGLYYSQKCGQMVIAYLTLVVAVVALFAICIAIPFYSVKTKRIGELSTIIYVMHMSIILLAYKLMETTGANMTNNYDLFTVATTIVVILIGIIICFIGNRNKMVRKIY